MKNECGQKLKLITLLFFCMLNLLYMHNYIIQTCNATTLLDWTSWIDNICRVCFDVWVIFSLCMYVIKRRVKICILLTFFVTLLWAFSNVIYSRFFSHYLSLTSILEADAMTDPLVFKSVLVCWEWSDIFFALMILLFIVFYNHFNYNISYKQHIKGSLALFSLLFFINVSSHILLCSLNPSLRYLNYIERRVSMRLFGQNHLLALPNYAIFHNGSIKSLVIEFYYSLNNNIKLSDDQSATITKELIKTRQTLKREKGVNVDNVIIILVESYMSFVTDMIVDGREVTPFLNSLKSDSAVYYNGRVHSNITMGESADGQYILMTGILPLRSMITVSKADKKPLPSLAKSLQLIGIKDSRMILPTPSSLWRQDDMCRQYGFSFLFDCNDYHGKHGQTLTDSQVFDLASEKDSLMAKHRFFSIVLTATMHQPYNKIVDNSFLIKDNSLTSEMKSYLNACHYTDKCIGNYLESLKRRGLYSKSLIVITADHHVHNANLGENVTTDIPLFIINGNIDNEAYRGACNQVDIYTTLIDVLGIKKVWSGLGSSLLNTCYENSVTPLKWDISELLLLSDYFYLNDYN